jgi:hypothetical protein
MTRAIAVFAFVVLTACSSSRPAVAPPPPIDPHADPTIVGTVDEAVLEGLAAAEKGAAAGRAIGSVVGVFAAVFGGPRHESLDDAVDRYRLARDAGEAIGAVIGATRGMSAGAERGYEFDLRFAELLKIEGVQATRPLPGEIQVRLASSPSPETLAAVAAVFEGREERAIDLEGPGDAVLSIREALIDLGVPSASLSARRNDAIDGVVMRVRYR